jgi:ectoine hydroxylase-related dioxygenase (phytanoyl-CoA dioxygenase family)
MKQKTPYSTANDSLVNKHKDIPGNPSVAKSSSISLRTEATPETLRVLTMEQWKFWREQGYVVIKNAVPANQAKQTADFLWEFEDKKSEDKSTWYTAPRAEMQMKELAGTGMVEVYNNQHLWNNRQTQKVYNAFVDIWGTERLWVSIDRANLNFPIRPGFEYKGFIHWDYDPETKPQNVQGVLALADQTDNQMGGFQCIPWLYKNYDSWKLTQPKDRDRFKPDISGLEDKLVKVKMEAGDLLIFNSSQPHGIRPNNSKDKVRIAQYLSMMPAQEEELDLVSWRINSWKNRIAPEGHAFPGDPRKKEQTHYEKADLSELGKKLLGQKKW